MFVLLVTGTYVMLQCASEAARSGNCKFDIQLMKRKSSKFMLFIRGIERENMRAASVSKNN